MPLYMRLGKQRGNTSDDAFPVGPFRTRTVPVNLRELETRFGDGAEVTPEALVEAGVLKNTRVDVKILGEGDLTKKLTVTAHRFSATARAKIEQAGGTAISLRETISEEGPAKAPETEEVAAAETVAAAKGERGAPDEAVDSEPEGAAEAAEGEG
jgi:ribosomal protein L18E